MTSDVNTSTVPLDQPAADASAPVDDFFSDEPLTVCPMRKDGMSEDENCEACQ